MAKKKSTNSSRKAWRTAKNSDKHELYELSVQGTESDCIMIDRVFRKRLNRTPHTLREDFSGTGLMSREWVQWRATNSAVGVDLDASVAPWARKNLDAFSGSAQAN